MSEEVEDAAAGRLIATATAAVEPPTFPAHPWFRIWIRPRQTLRQIIESDPRRHVILLAATTGIFFALGTTPFEKLVARPDLVMQFGTRWISQPVMAIIALFVFAKLLSWTGRWVGGSAPTVHLRAAIAWPSLWLIAAGVAWLAERALFVDSVRSPLMLDRGNFELLKLAMDGVRYALLFGFLSQLVRCVAEVQGFAPWKGLLNVALASLVVAVPIAALFGGLILSFLER
jgi:hypothetical protein